MADPITIKVGVTSVFTGLGRLLGKKPRELTEREKEALRRESDRIGRTSAFGFSAFFRAPTKPPSPTKPKTPSKPIPKAPPQTPKKPSPKPKKPPQRARTETPRRKPVGAPRPPAPPTGPPGVPGGSDIPKPTPGRIFGALAGLLRVNPYLRILIGVIEELVIPGIEAETERAKRARETVKARERAKREEELKKTKEKLRKKAQNRVEVRDFPKPAPQKSAEKKPSAVEKSPEILPKISEISDPVQEILRQRARERAREQIARRTGQRVPSRTTGRAGPAAPRLQLPPLIVLPQLRTPTRIAARPVTRPAPTVPGLDTFQPQIGSVTPGQPQTTGTRDSRGKCRCKCRRSKKKRKKPRRKCKEGFFREKMFGGEEFTVWREVNCRPELPI